MTTPWLVKHRQRGDLIGMVVDRIVTPIEIKKATETEPAVLGQQVLYGVNWVTIDEKTGVPTPEGELPSPSFHTPTEILHTGDYPIIDTLKACEELLSDLNETLEIAGGIEDEDEASTSDATDKGDDT